MAKKNELDFHLPSADDLFSTQEEREDAKLKRIYEISLDEIDPFPKHPFKVKEDEDMKTLVDSIKEFRVLTPATVRRKEDGRYELLSGHRRKRACELAGLDTLRCEVVELDKDAATIFMVDSNLQRTTILPSEKAFSYKMRYDAMKRQAGARTDLTGDPLEPRLKTSQLLALETSESASQIKRYIRLTYLIPQLLEMVDEGKIALRPAVEISYLPRDMQESLVAAIHYEDSTPSHAQARELRALSDKGILTQDLIYHMMGEEKPNQKDRFILKADRVKELFPKNLPISQREDYVVKAMEHYAKYRARRERERER
ncbi:ParB/RepB/Spo0J family partition protein [Mogibacterium kristiansenii]|uniref:ParB/RepB/Spo0J family partition protein n=1 Tax=Mogibacterium kristiansenii TaxID=2606708 RepID=UPI00240922B1|nr:ParB/RepB/Spo0J family partition protein [Mogibacterium kristiansenii]MDD6699808.1 ParB/RepB/Spo0J family partition protein [Mogibacterium kristiansenii]